MTYAEYSSGSISSAICSASSSVLAGSHPHGPDLFRRQMLETRMIRKRSAFCSMRIGGLAVDLIVSAESASKAARSAEAKPVEKSGIAVAVPALGQEDHDPAILQRLTAVLHRLVRLDQVDVLRKAAAGDDDQVALFAERKGKLLGIIAAAPGMGFPPVPAKAARICLSGDSTVFRMKSGFTMAQASAMACGPDCRRGFRWRPSGFLPLPSPG